MSEWSECSECSLSDPIEDVRVFDMVEERKEINDLLTEWNSFGEILLLNRSIDISSLCGRRLKYPLNVC